MPSILCTTYPNIMTSHFLDWVNRSALPQFPFTDTPSLESLSLEKEATYAEVYKNSPWKNKILLQFVKLFGYLPDLAFQKEDVDWKVVDKLLKHPELLKVTQEWVTDTKHDLLPQLKEAKRVFESIQRPTVHPQYFRGFTINPAQQTNGLDKKYKKMALGEKWQNTPTKPVSFSWHKGTTKAYGNIIVSVDGAKNARRMLHITHEVIAATWKMDDAEFSPSDDFHLFTYAESVFLPDEKPLEFTLVSKG